MTSVPYVCIYILRFSPSIFVGTVSKSSAIALRSDTKMDEAERRREQLRSELHGYGALLAEPDLEELCLKVESTCQDRQLDDFMRKAGGLKLELTALVRVSRTQKHFKKLFRACIRKAYV